MQGHRGRLHLLSSIFPSSALPAASDRSDAKHCSVTPSEVDRCEITFRFDEEVGSDGAGLTPVHRERFVKAFYQEMARLKQWAWTEHWLPERPPELHVIISEQFRISRSLVPAWHGQSGHMEFPSWRVTAGEPAIAHELAHVFFPNANRFLAEGLAVCLQAKIGGNPAFPNFGTALHVLARERLEQMLPRFVRGEPTPLDHLHLAELDKIATPAPLELTVGQSFYGQEPRGQAHIYPLVGSFTQFLIETRGLDRFRALYMMTPLV